MTIYEFCKANRVEVVYNKNGKHECYIDFKDGDRPYAVADNALDAIDAGVANYLGMREVKYESPAPANTNKEENEMLKDFLSKEALFIWYFYAKKYEKIRIVHYYETLANQTHPNYMNILRFIYDKVNEAVLNPSTKIMNDYPALNNVFIQALVYHEALEKERYETSVVIRDMQNSMSDENKKAFEQIQDTINKIEAEIQKIE